MNSPSQSEVQDQLSDALVEALSEQVSEAEVEAAPQESGIVLSQVKVGEAPVRRVDGRYFTRLDGFAGWEATATGIQAIVGDSIFKVDFLDADLIRLQIKRGGEGPPTYGVIRDESTWKAEFVIEETTAELVLRTESMHVVLKKFPFSAEAFRRDGSPILECPAEDELGNFATLNDAFIVSRRRSATDSILGLGQKTGGMDRSGRCLILWNTDVLNPRSVKEFSSEFEPGDPKGDPRSQEFDPYYISIPFYQTVDEQGRAAGFYIDNLHRGEFDYSQPDVTRIRLQGGEYTEYIFAGPSLARVVEGYTGLTGRISPPPIWALGYHHCRWHPYSAQDVLDRAATYRVKGIPCDSMWLDIDHMHGYRVFTWNPKLFPQPQETLSALAKMKFRVVTIIDPGVKVEQGYPVYEEGLKRDAFCRTEQGAIYQGQVWPGRTAFPDFANPVAREWWGELNADHIRHGLAGIWNDMNEPATGDIPDGAMRFDHGKYSHGTYHNAYALLMAMGTFQGIRKALPDQRPFILSRAGCAGIQRYAANWLGDNMSRWAHLAMSIPMSLGLGLSGQPFIGADIGGFGENCEPELLIRWFQAATLTPFCRNHNDAGGIDQYPWSFGSQAEEICKAAIDLRYRLLPYIYTAFIEASKTGRPIMSPLLLEDQTDSRLRDIGDEYLFGPNLLVAPVVEAGIRSRIVVLPRGEWFDWWTGERVAESEIAAEAPLSKIPLFARAGAVIPMWPEAPESTMDYHPEILDLRVVAPSGDGEFRSILVEDDGFSYGFDRGERLVTELVLTRRGTSLKLEGHTSGKPYSGFRRTGFRLLLDGAMPHQEVIVEASQSGFSWTN